MQKVTVKQLANMIRNQNPIKSKVEVVDGTVNLTEGANINLFSYKSNKTKYRNMSTH